MAEAKLFSIGEVAKLFHVSVSSLRHYEAAGLLQPEYISPDSGYRHYSTRQFEVLNTLRYLRALGMPLHEIADFLQNRNLDLLYGVLNGWAPEQCLQFGWASGVLAASSLNDYAEPADEKQVWDIYKGNARVQR